MLNAANAMAPKSIPLFFIVYSFEIFLTLFDIGFKPFFPLLKFKSVGLFLFD